MAELRQPFRGSGAEARANLFAYFIRATPRPEPSAGLLSLMLRLTWPVLPHADDSLALLDRYLSASEQDALLELAGGVAGRRGLGSFRLIGHGRVRGGPPGSVGGDEIFPTYKDNPEGLSRHVRSRARGVSAR